MECVKENQVVDLLSGGDDDDGFPVPGDDSYVLYAYQNDRVFGWEMVVSGACADESKNQVLERIEICPRFRAEWSDELKNHPYAFLLHSSGNLVFLELELEGGDCYMTPGKMVSVLCGFKKPVEVIFRYDFSDDDNCFTIESVDGRRVAGVIGSDVEGRDIIDLSDDTTYTLHGYHNDRVFGWEMIVTDAYACESNEQVLVSIL
ncbi:hypothetical protein TSUD_215810 [Trifolium subterraneum]|uniref:Uncharacterized protein n=1 Tax=Trifolium subterraneum TaxID=3900 RepID=A0A2Z6MVN3_TRISU|nr:hypothetical protein TSUD_215810 [Trifolium subterraneum]